MISGCEQKRYNVTTTNGNVYYNVKIQTIYSDKVFITENGKEVIIFYPSSVEEI
jgi:hypothetical protein